MADDRETRRAVLQGVYEENAGLPRSSTGKRKAAPGPAPQEPDRAHWAGRRSVLALVLVAIALIGIELRVGPDSSQADARSPPRFAMAPYALPPAPGDGAAWFGPLADEPAAAPGLVAAATDPDRYDTMLSRLGMPVADLFDLEVRTIVIDPGHGGRDPGAVGPGGLLEKDVALQIALGLRDKLLAEGNYRVLLTRDDDSLMRLKERVDFAGRSQADLFISIHINAVPQEAGSFNYVETYYFGPHSDQRTLELAEYENRGSDYAMGDFREVIARLGDTVKIEESARLAATMHRRLFDNLKRDSSNLMDAGVKSGPFMVLLGVEVPSVLIEVSCLSNELEAERLSTPEYRDKVATYLKMGIVEYLDQRAARNQPDGVKKPYVAQQNG